LDTKRWINLKGTQFEESPVQWYNLRTSRHVNKKPGTYTPVYGIKGTRVLGTKADIENFWRLNSQQLAQILAPNVTLETVIFEPFENIAFLSEDAAARTQMCFIGTAGTVIPATTSTDVETLTQEQMDHMCKFTFGGLFVKGRIDTIVDGDTFDIVFFAPIISLGRSRTLGEKQPFKTPIILTQQRQTVPGQITEYENVGFFAKVAIRMYGYDAAEKDTDAGKLAKRLMEEKFRSLNGIVWCQFIEAHIADDKYGRTLAVLYEDEQKTRLINNYLLEQETIHNVKMVFPYLGGTKKQF
jgi:endonuclease YncB( thermonuclease family)